ncbi:MAG: hypothetical protein ACI9BF_000815, partial [Candidatus Paceibacteria bacterium]
SFDHDLNIIDRGVNHNATNPHLFEDKPLYPESNAEDTRVSSGDW